MHSHAQSPHSLFHAILWAVIAALLVMLANLPAYAQNSVPPTAVQAAKMPQYASRLAHPTKQLLAPKPQPLPRAKNRRGPLDSTTIYENGPIDGNTDAWTINFGFIVSDSINIAADSTTVTGMSFGVWLNPGDTVASVEVSFTSSENGGTSYFDQTVNFTQGSCTGNIYGFNICTETATFTGPTLNAGAYWVNLQNASAPSDGPVYWDENSGVGCTGQGCPSLASENSVGSIPSESFTILGNATTTTTTSSTVNSSCPEAQNGFHDLYDFASGFSPSGLATDTTGKLYGTLPNAGIHSAGQVFDLVNRAGHWFFGSLYSFLGGSNGSRPDGVIVGPQGVLYGSADGGIANCGGSYCGLIYQASPGPTACATALCSWNETTIYQFTSNTDAAGGFVTAFDSAGNLYGISRGGGTYGQGAIFELSPAQGGWTEKILYSFSGGADGAGPNSLLLGQDGNLYGAAGSGGKDTCDFGSSCGVVFQLVPSGGGWIEHVIYAFTGSADSGWSPGGLIQDQFGGLLGFAVCHTFGPGQCFDGGVEYGGLIFRLQRSGAVTRWQFSQFSQYRGQACELSDFVTYKALALDAAGNLYAVDGGGLNYLCGAVLNITAQTDLVAGYDPVFGNLISDRNGNLYGTTDTCGFGSPSRANGMIWQYSP